MLCIVYFTFREPEKCFNRLRHFHKVNEVFLIVYVTFIKRARCFELFTSLLYSEPGVLNCLRHFYKASEVF